METVVDSLLDLQDWFLYTDRMKNKNPINSVIIKEVSVRKGNHEYEAGNPEVIEITFEGYNVNYVQVIDLKTARELDLHLRKLLPPLYQEL